MSIGGIFLYKSYAYYENEKEYNVIKGIIPDFSYDVKFAINVDGEKKDNIPESAIGDGNKYYEVTATCDDGIKAEWDYNAWNLKVDNITKGTKCTLAFNSKLTETDYQNYIKAGVAYRRNTYRGKDITSKLKDGSLFKEISSGHFDDIFVGDYIKSTTKDESDNEITWLIADLDNYLHTGYNDNELTKHHATIIPAMPLKYAQMNTTATTTGGYANSDMVKTTLPQVLTTYINPDFGTNNPSPDKTNHVISYNNLLTNGETTNWQWYDRQLDLMSEINVLGSAVWSSSGFDIGSDNRQYAIFQLKPELINSDGQGNRISSTYWLKSVFSATSFSSIHRNGDTYTAAASANQGVRPRFLIG